VIRGRGPPHAEEQDDDRQPERHLGDGDADGEQREHHPDVDRGNG
jgi:hypothetical protein